MVPDSRLRALNQRPARIGGQFVLYWMTASRRLEWNWGLQHAAEEARRLRLPLLILEALRVDHPWASVRFHRFVLEGMRDTSARLRELGPTYFPYVEPESGAGRGLVEALAARSALVVTDDFPAYFLPRMASAVADRLDVRLVAVDSNGLLPLSVGDRTFKTAYSFRRFLQKTLPDHLLVYPDAEPLGEGLRGVPPGALDEVFSRWRRADLGGLLDGPAGLGILPMDQGVTAIPGMGGRTRALETLNRFLDSGMSKYGEDRNHPDREGSSGLSPWLHWGQISSQEVFHAVAGHEGWTPLRLSVSADGSRRGWWGLSEGAEAFLDQLVTWREIGFNMCARNPLDYDRYESLPDWARNTLSDHASDPRPFEYSLEAFEAADTHDPLWNAAQRQLRREGIIHNYLRMLWGKKILEWSPSPRDALEVMIRLNDRYALDGRDPNSYAGIFWILGRYDRGWPERPVFGKVRSMSSDSTRRKVRLDRYLERFGP